MSGLHPPLLPSLDDAPGPATPLSKQGRATLRARILHRARQRTSRQRDRAWLRTPLGVAAACALAFASVGTGLAAVRVWPALSVYLGNASAEPAAQAQVAETAARVRSKLRAPRVPTLPAAEPPAGVVAPEPVPSAPAAHAAQRHNPSRTNANTTAHSTANAVPLDLLARANRLRGEQRWQQAEALYLRVLATEDDQPAHAAAALAAADLRLQHLGKPRAALALFERALRLQPGGALAEQARHGIAKCFRALGDDLHEIEALNAYLHAHPQSPMAARNSARLRELTGSGP